LPGDGNEMSRDAGKDCHYNWPRNKINKEPLASLTSKCLAIF